MVGGIIQMINHGLSTSALFLIVGMIYERRHTRLISEFGGIWRVMPAFSVLFLIVCLSSLGLPGLNGFIGEFLVLLGAFQVDRRARRPSRPPASSSPRCTCSGCTSGSSSAS